MDEQLTELLKQLRPEELAYFTQFMVENRDAVTKTRPELAAVFNALMAMGDDERRRRDDPRQQRAERHELIRMYLGADSFKPAESGWVTE